MMVLAWSAGVGTLASAPALSAVPASPEAPRRTDLRAAPATQATIDFPVAGSTITQASLAQVPIEFHISGTDAIAAIQVVVCGDPGSGGCNTSYLPTSTLTVPAGGPYRVSWNPPAAGARSTERSTSILVQVFLTLADGTSSPSAIVPFSYVYNPASAITLRFPQDGQTLLAPATAVLWGTASFVDGSNTSVQRIEFFDGMDLLGEVSQANVSPSGYAWTWTNVPEGAHEIWMRVVDAQGRETETDSATLYVLPPPAPISIALDSPITGTTYAYRVPVTLRSTASIARGHIERVEYLDGIEVIATATVPPYEASWPMPSDGMHAISARAWDTLGNATASRAAYIMTAGEPRAFRAIVKSPLDQSVHALGATVRAELAFDAPDAPPATVEYAIDGEFTSVGTSPFAYSFVPSWTGKHTLHATARDTLSRFVSTETVHFFVTQDGKPPIGDQPTGPPPTVTLTAPADHASLLLGSPVDLVATADGHGYGIKRVDFSVNGSVVGSAAASPYRYSWTPPSVGSYQVTATASSASGRSAVSKQISIDVAYPPSWASVAPVAAGAVFFAGDTVVLKPSELHVTGNAYVEYLVDGVAIGTVGAPYLFEWDAPGPGTYNVSIRVHDDLGTSPASAAVPVTVKPVTIVITSPVDGAIIGARSAFVEGVFDGPSNVGVRINGSVATRSANGRFFMNAVALAEGTTTLTAEITSAGGSRESTSVSVQMASTVDDDTPDVLDVISEGVDTLSMPLMVANPESVASWRLLDANGAQMAQGGTTSDGTLTTASYAAPGLYRQTLEVTDRKGRVSLRSVNAQVITASDLKAQHVAVIDRFFGALAKQRKERALSTLTGGMALVFGQVYDALSDRWPEIVQSIAAVGTTSHGLNHFEAAAIRDRDGQRYVYLIEGIKDDDGVWRIDSF